MDKKVLLIILDGYGEGKDTPYNAVTHSKTPFLDKLRKTYPYTLLKADGEHVGLPKKSMGGSEVGHFTIGAGRIVYQSLEEINQSIKKGELFEKKALKKAAEICRKNKSKFHILGMISDQGIHSHLNHLFALIDFAKQEKLEDVYIHAITDGRDVPERSAEKYIKKIENYCKKTGIGKIATIIGRYYGMDRDKNFDRTKKAYDLMTSGEGNHGKNATNAIKNEYTSGTDTDYYITPNLIDQKGLIEDKDAVVFFNFRTDRAKQLTEAFTEKNFRNFKRNKTVLPYFVCFGPYSKTAPVLYQANKVKNNLGETLSKNNKSQLRVAETEKYAHVTYFFNSQVKEPYPGEKQILVPSAKVPSYDLKPEMSAPEITETVIKEMKKGKFDFILLNYANGDLVGHSGDFKATVKGIEAVDKCLTQLIPEALKDDYTILLTADHGNADEMKYENGEDKPSHTLNPVIFMVISEDGNSFKLRKEKNLGLKDIAPTVLQIMQVKQPKEMTGKSIIK